MMPEFSIVLVEPKYPSNIGRVARVMKNFGFSKLILVNPPELDAKARTRSMHGLDVLKKAKKVNSLIELKKEFHFLVATSAIVGTDRNALRTPVKPEELATAINTDGKIGLVFGREDIGLLNEEIEQCDLFVSIPSDSKYPTLSLPQSVGIILYELTRLKLRESIKGKKYQKMGKTGKRVLLEKFDHLADLLYYNEFDNKLVKKTFRQLLGRAFISGREAFTLIGLFRRLGEKVEK